jgi:hypothetical protein
MTCTQLAQRGPSPDGYVRLTDVRPCRQGPVFWRDGLSPGHVELYIPAYPSGLENEPDPAHLSFLLEILDDDELRLLELPGTGDLTCEVQRGPGRVEEWARRALEVKYAGLRLADLWVLTVGLHEPTASRARSAMAYGIGSILAGGTILAWLTWRRKPAVAFEAEPSE